MRLLQTLGYTNVWHYAGGLAEWTDAGLPLDTAASTARRAPIADARPVRRDAAQALVDRFEALSTRHLVVFWFGTIFTCAAVYWMLASMPAHALRTASGPVRMTARGLLTALYFSFVTATSVGFGDVVPLGAARAVAIAEAVAGLLVFGLVVSKLVSRRQEQIVGEIHRISFEARLERVQTDLHLVLSELQAVMQMCQAPSIGEAQVRARIDSAAGICLGQLRTIHDLLYRPQTMPDENVLEGILAGLALVLQELRELLRCLASRSPYLTRTLASLARLADDICSDCVPRRYTADLRGWMDQIQDAARAL